MLTALNSCILDVLWFVVQSTCSSSRLQLRTMNVLAEFGNLADQIQTRVFCGGKKRLLSACAPLESLRQAYRAHGERAIEDDLVGGGAIQPQPMVVFVTVGKVTHPPVQSAAVESVVFHRNKSRYMWNGQQQYHRLHVTDLLVSERER